MTTYHLLQVKQATSARMGSRRKFLGQRTATRSKYSSAVGNSCSSSLAISDPLRIGPPGQVASLAGKKDGMKQGELGGILKELGYTEEQV